MPAGCERNVVVGPSESECLMEVFRSLVDASKIC